MLAALNINYPPLPPNMIAYKTGHHVSRFIEIDNVKTVIIKLLASDDLQHNEMGLDLYVALCLGLRRNDLLRVKFTKNNEWADIIEIVELKNKNTTSRIVPTTLKELLIRTNAIYPINTFRLKRLQEFCMSTFGRFYGLRHCCISSCILALLKAQHKSEKIHRSNQTTLKYYVNKENYAMVNEIFCIPEIVPAK
jgi:integrase